MNHVDRLRPGWRKMFSPAACLGLAAGLVLFAPRVSLAVDAGGAAVSQASPERIRELLQSVRKDAPQADPEDLAGIAALFETLFSAQAPRASADRGTKWLSFLDNWSDTIRGQLIARQFDVDRLLGVLEVAQVDRRGMSQQTFRNVVQKNFFRGVATQPMFTSGENYQVKRLELLPNKHEGKAVVRHRLQNGLTFKVAWWLSKREGKWLVWDLEDLDTGIRTSSSLVAILSRPDQEIMRQATALKAVTEACRAVQQADLQQAKELLEPTLDVPLVRDFEAIRWIIMSAVRFSEGEYEEALKYLKNSEVIRKDTPSINNMRAKIYNQLGKYELARENALLYLEKVGDDADSLDDLGIALAGLGRKQEAAEAHRKGLAEEPDLLNNLVGLARLLPEDETAEIVKHYQRIEKPKDHFEELAQALLDENLFAALNAILPAYRQLVGEDSAADFYEGAMLRRQRKYELAAARFKAGLGRDRDDLRLQEGFFDSMLELRRPVEGYQHAPDRGFAFEYLASQLVYRYARNALARLIEAHRQHEPEDPRLLLYEGRLQLRRKKFDEAAACFAKGMLQADNESESDWKRYYLDAMVGAKKMAEAYANAPDPLDTFPSLANRLYWEEQSEALGQLIALHQAQHPDDNQLAEYRAHLLILQGKHAEAADLLKTLLPKFESAYDQYIFLETMVKLGKPAEAYRLAPYRTHALPSLAYELIDQDDAKGLEELLQAVEELDAAHAQLPYFRGRLLVLQERLKDAMQLLQPITEKISDPDDRTTFLESYATAAVDAQQTIAAYRQAVDADEVFAALADVLLEREETQTLQQLIAAHRERFPEEKHSCFYQGKIHELAKEYGAAALAYSKGIKEPADEATQEQCRYGYEEAMVHAGRAIEAYAEAAVAREAFHALAQHCVEKKDSQQLAALVAAHREKDAADPELVIRQAQIHWLRKEFAQVVEVLSKLPRESSSFLSGEDLLIRSLIYLRRFDEAVPLADLADSNVPWYTALVAACRNDSDTAIAALEECLEYSYHQFDELEADEILGPILRTEKYQAFRARHAAQRQEVDAEAAR